MVKLSSRKFTARLKYIDRRQYSKSTITVRYIFVCLVDLSIQKSILCSAAKSHHGIELLQPATATVRLPIVSSDILFIVQTTFTLWFILGSGSKTPGM